jgi:hypothetical protein
MDRRTFLGTSAGAATAVALGTSPAFAAPARARGGLDEQQVLTWFKDTYRSLEAMVADSGLPADNIDLSGDKPVRSANTSSTNIGAWLWSTVAAAALGVISEAEMHRRLERAVSTIERMERLHGFWFNWYDTFTGEVLTRWPGSGDPVSPLLSTVDNGWFDVGLRVVHDADPLLRDRIAKLREGVDWSFFYAPYDASDPAANPGQMRTGFDVDQNKLTPYFYGALASETRIASYLGIGDGTVPREHYWHMQRTFDPGVGQQMPPAGQWVVRDGVRYFNGHYTYRGLTHTPGWGGSMFEALMPELFVPSARWSPRAWGVNLARHVRGHRLHGLKDAEYGYWGFSPCDVPEGGYQEYGVQWFGIGGYSSSTDRVQVPYGQPMPPPSTWTNGVVTPHASFLAMLISPADAYANLARIARDFDIYEDGMGFRDSVNVRTGKVSAAMLSLDQGMSVAALAQVLRPGTLQRPFTTGAFAGRLRPLLGREDFGLV